MPHVLIIEDSVVQAHTLQRTLEREGFTVTVACDGETGLACLESTAFDLVLSDILMPGISGYDLCRWIKTNPVTKEYPVVLLTQLSDPLDILCGLECGADNFITKPYSPEFLVGRLKKVLESKDRRAALLPDRSVELSFRGRGVTITSDKEQILDLLLATLEEFIRSKEREHEAQVAKEALEKSQQFVQSALNSLTTAVAILDEDGTILATNDAWLRCNSPTSCFGANYGVGINYLAVCDSAEETDKRSVANGIREVIGRQRDELSLDYSGGSDTSGPWFSITVTRFAAQGPPRTVVAQRDITERVRLEASLTQKVAELDEANRRTNQFLAMLAHELRNPLVPLHNGLHLLRIADTDRDTVARSYEMMERQLEHLTHIVNDLLDVSRITRGKLCVKLERMDLGRLVRNNAGDNRAAVKPRTLVLDIPETPVWVRGDATRLSQVLDNLVLNAVKFTDSDDHILVRLIKDEEQQQAVLSVIDTGIGIELDLLPSLFDVFVQADQNLDRSRGGLGLGLSLVKSLVDLHGGTVQAFSEGPSHGATFTVQLPLEPEPRALVNYPDTQQPAVPAKSCRVLIVEDNRDAADSLKLLLQWAGHDVAVAYSGPEGVRTAAEWQPDVVLCDIGLPGMDGYQVVEALKKNSRTAGARMIAVTGYGQEEDRVRSREAGFDHHLTKPVSPRLIEDLCSLTC